MKWPRSSERRRRGGLFNGMGCSFAKLSARDNNTLRIFSNTPRLLSKFLTVDTAVRSIASAALQEFRNSTASICEFLNKPPRPRFQRNGGIYLMRGHPSLAKEGCFFSDHSPTFQPRRMAKL